MGDIKAFLLPPVMEETKEIIVTKRAKGPDGKPVPFVIRAIDQETNNRLIRQAVKKRKENGVIIRDLDDEKYNKLLVQAAVIEPDLKNAELCAHYKTVDPLDVSVRMLSAGEFQSLCKAIRELSGFVGNDLELEEAEEELKN